MGAKNLTCEDMNINIIAQDKEVVNGNVTKETNLGNMTCFISPIYSGIGIPIYTFTIPHKV